MSERILSRMMRAAGDGLHDRLMVERNSTKAWDANLFAPSLELGRSSAVPLQLWLRGA